LLRVGQVGDDAEPPVAGATTRTAATSNNRRSNFGVDLYGLALWRSYGSTPRLRACGSEMEAGLWRDIANLYQPELRPPFSIERDAESAFEISRPVN
jgi:hypothetical protein